MLEPLAVSQPPSLMDDFSPWSPEAALQSITPSLMDDLSPWSSEPLAVPQSDAEEMVTSSLVDDLTSSPE